MKFCASCGSPLNDEKFCPKCGTQVSGEAPENIAGSGLEKKPQKMVPASKKVATAMEALYLPVFAILVLLMWDEGLYSNKWSTVAHEGIAIQSFLGIMLWSIVWFTAILILLSKAKSRGGKKNSPLYYIFAVLFFVIVLFVGGTLAFS